MRTLTTIASAVLTLNLSFLALANAQNIGFATVEQALASLKSRKEVNISNQGGWLIANDNAAGTVWSFTPATHPAHPAVVKRTIVTNSGQIGVEMDILCQAEKTACDGLLAEFTELNNRMAQEVQSRSQGVSFNVVVAPSNKDKEWRPVETDAAQLEKRTLDYFALKDTAKYDQAYALYADTFRQTTNFDTWRTMSVGTAEKLGPMNGRTIKRLVWYKDPAGAQPGVYAAIDFSGTSRNADFYCGYIVWRQQPNNSFALVREEQNILDKATAEKLSPSELEKARVQIGC